jgi:hypothetical protein
VLSTKKSSEYPPKGKANNSSTGGFQGQMEKIKQEQWALARGRVCQTRLPPATTASVS